MPPSFHVWNVSHAVFTSGGYWVSSWYMSRGQAITGMVGVGWGGVIRRKILRGVKLVGRGWGKSGFLGTCLFRRSQVLLPDFSHSTLCRVRKPKAKMHRCIFIVKWNERNHHGNFCSLSSPSLCPDNYLAHLKFCPFEGWHHRCI